MKSFVVLAFVSLVSFHATAQNIGSYQDRMALQNLLAERAENFSEYTNSIQKRSGIFGNKTKRDLEKSNEVLIQIVTLDNDIMNALQRALNYKTFEKTTDNYSARDCEQKLQKSMHVTDTLAKQLTALEKKFKKRDSSSAWYKGLFYLTFTLFLITLVLYVRKREAKL